jgi:hypothetical protein
MSISGSDTDALRQASVALALEGLAARVATALGLEGVRTILIKGPALSEWLYPGDVRRYSDVDLLIHPKEQDAAESLLEKLDFAPVAIDVLPHDRPHHARTWVAPGGAAVDLHHTLIGVEAPSETVWDVLAADTDWLQVGNSKIEVLSRAGRALVVVLHAAQHGPSLEQPLEDLRRVLERLSLEDWQEVRQVADRLQALPAFGAGLRLLPRGRTVATELALPETTSVDTVLRSTSAPTMALGFDWLWRTHGLRRKAWFVTRKIAPPPEFMRAWTPPALRGRGGLAVAYLWRIVWLAFRAPPAYIAWRKAARATRPQRDTGSEPHIDERLGH